MRYSRIKTVFISCIEMNRVLSKIEDTKEFVFSKTIGNIGISKAFIEDKMKEFKVTYRQGGQAITYICFKDNDSKINIKGVDAWRILSQYHKVHELPANFSVSAILYKNDKYDGTRNNAFGYDMNSCYSWAMLQDIPDTTKKPYSGEVGENKVGFDLDGNRITIGYAPFIFPLIESPFKKFIEVWYNKKKKAKDKKVRQKAKNVLNFVVGYFQLKNPWLRANIIGIANKRILELIDENTLYCNTDSLVSLVERKDITIGKNIGEFKLEHKGLFAFNGFNSQWNYDIPSYRGIPKSWFKKGWDILKDELPNDGNIYKFNYNKMRLEYNEKEDI